MNQKSVPFTINTQSDTKAWSYQNWVNSGPTDYLEDLGEMTDDYVYTSRPEEGEHTPGGAMWFAERVHSSCPYCFNRLFMDWCDYTGGYKVTCRACGLSGPAEIEPESSIIAFNTTIHTINE